MNTVQGAYKLSEDFAKTIFTQILKSNTWCYYHLKEECLQFYSDLKSDKKTRKKA